MDDESTQELKENEEEGSDLDTGVEEDESLSSEDSDDDTTDVEGDEPDWKALYEKEKLEKENYRKGLTQKRQLRKQPKVEVVEEEALEEEDDDDDDKPVTRAELRQIQSAGTVDSMLSNLVTDPNKRQLVKLFYETRIVKSGTSDDAIRADLESALDLADAKKLRKTVSEVARVANQEKIVPNQGSASDRASVSKDHKFSAEQVAALTASAKRIGADPAKFIAEAWKNQNKG